jgi:mRNA-degrading endonuclease toxin of MazEF toxin-antitoxin module
MAAPPVGWHPKRGEVYIVRLDKPRPAIVLSIDPINKFALDVCVVGIATVERKTFSMRVPIKKGDANLDFNCWAKCDQVTTLEKALLRYPPIGMLSAEVFARIEEQVRICLGFL